MNALPSPYYLVDEGLLIKNLELLRQVADASGCKILLAQKAFSMYDTYPLIAQYLDGTASSGLHEVMLSRDYLKKENHVFSAGYSDEEFKKILPLCSHIVFNSFSQWERFKPLTVGSSAKFGIRINPEISTQGGGIYDPCAVGSRLGVTVGNFRFDEFEGNAHNRTQSRLRDDIPTKGQSEKRGCAPAPLSGLHFHTLCQQNADALETTLQAVEEKFSPCFKNISWLNMGGGHHITRPDYDIQKLVTLIKNFRQKHNLEIYLEPGEAVALNAGFLVCTVLDIIENDGAIAILDASAACHMPDVLEMPYTPRILGSCEHGKYTYRLGGSTCLAGDFIGQYSFNEPLQIGDKLTFEDMAIYTMVKNNTFNGINLPSIIKRRTNGELQLVRRFGYEDFRGRL
ncbi:MAG: carboxynorspermidine decarboxylase [Defluviitaleaceae bacterium]|nr:carboxynorspermidine decarboxylase [Defluviitaleaceae bacterium]